MVIQWGMIRLMTERTRNKLSNDTKTMGSRLNYQKLWPKWFRGIKNVQKLKNSKNFTLQTSDTEPTSQKFDY